MKKIFFFLPLAMSMLLIFVIFKAYSSHKTFEETINCSTNCSNCLTINNHSIMKNNTIYDLQNNHISNTLKTFDIKKYMGLWYEIARFDHSFERGMKDVTAFYTLNSDGKVSVLNSGYKNGKLKSAKGKGKQPDKAKPWELKVSFFLWFYADYNILMLSDDYSYALVGSSSDKYLWILSRTKTLSPSTLKTILNYAKQLGYDASKLIYN